MEERQVQRKKVDIKVKPQPKTPGFEIKQDTFDREYVILHLYKGKVSALDLYEKGKTIMFRVRIQFTGDLAKYLPIDASAAKETVETIDLDLELMEVFFKKKESSQAVRNMFSPMVEKYPVSKVGQELGTVKINYAIFTEFVAFIQYLSYAPFSGDVKI